MPKSSRRHLNNIRTQEKYKKTLTFTVGVKRAILLTQFKNILSVSILAVNPYQIQIFPNRDKPNFAGKFLEEVWVS